MITGNYKTLQIYVGGTLLDPAPSQRLVNHSPDGFAWGYGGSGPAQLALALLLHFTHDESWSLEHYQEFKTEVIAKWRIDTNVAIASRVVRAWIKKHGGPSGRA